MRWAGNCATSDNAWQRELSPRPLVQNTPTALLLTDPRERVVYGNLAARESFGVQGKLEGHAFEELVARLPKRWRSLPRVGQDGLVP